MYVIFLYHLNNIVNQLQLPLYIMMYPPRIENVVKAWHLRQHHLIIKYPNGCFSVIM